MICIELEADGGGPGAPNPPPVCPVCKRSPCVCPPKQEN